jgi:drug/metabolite transporter (DMT)-like permease
LLLFNEVPSAATLSGSALIVGSGLYLWQRTRSLEQEKTSR